MKPKIPPFVPGQKRATTSAMIASIAAEGQPTRPAPFGHALVEVAKSRPDIVGMTADLSKYTDLHIFAKAYPDRFYQMGMAEQVMFGAASGLAAEGFTPFCTTYAVFASRRAYDFIHQTIAEEDRNVKIVCALPGLTSGYGPSHQAAEDLALMRAMPNITIVDPCDASRSSRRRRRSRRIMARPTCASCAETCRWCSTSTATSSSWEGSDDPRGEGHPRHLLRPLDHACAGSREGAR